MKRYHVTEEYGLQINATENRPSSHLLSFPRHPSQDINFVRQTIYSSLRIKYIRKVNITVYFFIHYSQIICTTSHVTPLHIQACNGFTASSAGFSDYEEARQLDRSLRKVEY